jgi:hypothetical protein
MEESMEVDLPVGQAGKATLSVYSRGRGEGVRVRAGGWTGTAVLSREHVVRAEKYVGERADHPPVGRWSASAHPPRAGAQAHLHLEPGERPPALLAAGRHLRRQLPGAAPLPAAALRHVGWGIAGGGAGHGRAGQGSSDVMDRASSLPSDSARGLCPQPYSFRRPGKRPS